jgi:hypothetical protein
MRGMLFLFLALVGCTGMYAQDFTGRVRVELQNFYQSPSACGIFKTAGIYKAIVKDERALAFGKEILVYVVCKADRYPQGSILSKEVFITVSDKPIDKQTEVSNFSGYTDDELKLKKVYELVSVQSLPFGQ